MDFLTAHAEFGPIRLVVWEILYVIALLLVLSFVLDAILYRPVLRVLAERQRRLDDARNAQEGALRTLEEKTRAHAEAIAAARREAVVRMEAARAESEGAHRDKVQEAKRTAEGRVSIARDVITKTSNKAEQELRGSARDMGRRIASQVLGREVSA
jgi:F-type H+-transporting ATPase subunit b